MNLEPLIKSGYLEQYVLNELNPTDRAAMEKLRIDIPDIDEKIKEIESRFQALKNESVEIELIDKADDLEFIINREEAVESVNILEQEPTIEEVDHQIGNAEFIENPINEELIVDDSIEEIIQPIQAENEKNEIEFGTSKANKDEVVDDITEIDAETIDVENTIVEESTINENIKEEIIAQEPRIVHNALPINEHELPATSSPIQSKDMSNKFKFVSIAASLLAILFAAVSFYFFSKYQVVSKELTKLEYENKKHIEKYSLASNELSAHDVELKILYDEDFKKITLNTTDTVIKRNATIFWNKKSGKVYSNVSNLPTLSSNQQYQLWAIQGGKPVDLGVINDSATMLTTQNNIDKAEAFAITVEKSGGNATPTMDKMVVKAAAI